MRGPEKRDQSGSLRATDIARVLLVALSYVASSLAEPRPRIRESASLRSFYLARCVALRARICTAVRTGAKKGTHFVGIATVYIGLQVLLTSFILTVSVIN